MSVFIITQNGFRRTSKFLDRFPLTRRSGLQNLILSFIREGYTDEREVLCLLIAECKRRAQDEAFWLDAYFTVASNEPEALAHIREAIAWERLPQAVREQVKAARAERYRALYFKDEPPTERQKAFLARYGIVPLSKGQAMFQISQLRKGGGVNGSCSNAEHNPC